MNVLRYKDVISYINGIFCIFVLDQSMSRGVLQKFEISTKKYQFCDNLI